LAFGVLSRDTLYLVTFIDGADVLTVEGLDTRNKLSPEQEAFVGTVAFQCGYCTPGFVLMVGRLLDETPDPDDHQIKHYLSSNLCRFATYPQVIEPVKLAARKRKTGTPA
jgi:carbon-monoxide dehydrogenase small subunit